MNPNFTLAGRAQNESLLGRGGAIAMQPVTTASNRGSRTSFGREVLPQEIGERPNPTLLLIKAKLAAARRAADPELAKSLLEIEKLIDQADQKRSGGSEDFLGSNRAASLDAGLEARVRELAAEIGARYGIKIVVEDDGQPKVMREESSAVLLRSIREVLINASQHARAHRIRARLERGDRFIRATVENDGVLDAAASNGIGLFDIRERLEHAGGSMHIESVPEHGTTISLCAPWITELPTTTRANS